MRVEKDTKHHINITGGPLAYRYQFEEIYIHYGTENHQGSEHRVHGYAFPAEVGLFALICIHQPQKASNVIKISPPNIVVSLAHAPFSLIT
jgi:Eukaryotic-type carbonic anhydrase